MNAGQLRELLANLPDEAPVVGLSNETGEPVDLKFWTAGPDDLEYTGLEGLDSDSALIVNVDA